MRALTIGFLLIAATVACVAATFPVLDADRQAVIVFEQRLDCVPVGPVIRVGRPAPDENRQAQVRARHGALSPSSPTIPRGS